jgi:hypothetical protein
VPDQSGHRAYYSLITVRHVVDPVWLGCSTANPSRFFVRVNNKNFDPKSDKIGVSYFPIDLIHDGAPTWLKSDDDDVDLAVLPPPPELLSGNYDATPYLNLAKSQAFRTKKYLYLVLAGQT